MKKFRFTAIILLFCLLIALPGLALAVKEPEAVSLWERRKLQPFPALSAQSLVSGSFTADFDKFMADQFPLRNGLRRLKAQILFGLYRQEDNGGIYISGGSASKLDPVINESSVAHFTGRINDIYDTYLKGTDCRVFYSVIPDKNCFLAPSGGYPHFDYSELTGKIDTAFSHMEKIDLMGLLTAEDYYTTDTHWRQEAIADAAQTIRTALGIGELPEFEKVSLGDFYGVYYGQSALPLPPDELIYLTNSELEDCTVFLAEKGETGKIYATEKYAGMDPYDIFLSGAVALAEITNPHGDKNRELVIFRDSFGSSLAPLLVSGYGKVTLVDTRYIAPDMIGDFLQFGSQDVLFIYSTLLINDSSTLK